MPTDQLAHSSKFYNWSATLVSVGTSGRYGGTHREGRGYSGKGMTQSRQYLFALVMRKHFFQLYSSIGWRIHDS